MRIIYILIAALFINTATTSAQVIDFKKDNIWGEAGLGMYNFASDLEGFSFNIGLNMARNTTLYKAKFMMHEEFTVLGPSPAERFYHGGVMIGQIFPKKYIQLHVAGGLGITGGYKRVETNPMEYEQGKDKFITPSVPLEGSLMVMPFKNVGIGFTLFGDVNLEKPMYGALLNLKIGILRR